MNIMLKKPGRAEESSTTESEEKIFDMISDPEFVTFNEEHHIGMYIDDRGAYSGLKRNFLFSGSIIYGVAIFVGLDKRGRATNITCKALITLIVTITLSALSEYLVLKLL